MESVWYVVEAVNKSDKFKIEYPESADKQDEIAWGFQAASKANIDICAGAIDGVLIWIFKPSKTEAEKAEISQQKFLCGCKGKFGLNCQAVSDVNGRILDISIAYGGSSSDCLAFKVSELFEQCEKGLMKNGLVLFADNAYLNTEYMATPYTNVSGNPEYVTKDNYNFFYSLLRIRVECCFRMLVQHWGRLRMALHHRIPITCIVGLVNCLARLHNFCSAEAEQPDFNEILSRQLSVDVQHILESRNGYAGLQKTDNNEVVPSELLNNDVDMLSNLLQKS